MKAPRQASNLSHRWLRIRLSLVAALFAAACFAQSPTQLSGANPPPDDPAVYYSFLYFHDDFSGWLERRNAANPAGAARRAQAAARHFGVAESELPKISLVSRNAAAQFRALTGEMQAYIDRSRASQQTPDRAVFQQFEARRQQIITAAVGQLRATLTPGGWNALHAYINEQHRRSIKQATPEVRPQAR